MRRLDASQRHFQVGKILLNLLGICFKLSDLISKILENTRWSILTRQHNHVVIKLEIDRWCSRITTRISIFIVLFLEGVNLWTLTLGLAHRSFDQVDKINVLLSRQLHLLKNVGLILHNGIIDFCNYFWIGDVDMALRGCSHVTFDELRLVFLYQATIFDLLNLVFAGIMVLWQILVHILIDVCQERLIGFIFKMAFLFVLKPLVR